ncbi:MAG: DNA repair protein RadA [Clostridiales bacterium]|nr:DNA repair protein RadA [Clostridiales bacterium]
MAKPKTVFICSECGYNSSKWSGCCPECGEWNSMNEQVSDISPAFKITTKSLTALSIGEISVNDEIRFKTGMTEFDRVLGGGIVQGSLILLSGDPGIGKSTILLQVCEYLGNTLQILYISGEESAKQIKLRAVRLGVKSDNLTVMCETDVRAIINYIENTKPQLVIVDSIQTMNVSDISSTSGSVAQVRESTNLFMHCAKNFNISTVIIGHVNKDGNIAGPKVLEHIVDCVLYFEGERHLSYRILRAVKNRYGSTNEIGVFEMADKGLCEVPNPSLMLISGKPKDTAGTCIACIMEGSRPILAEVQGLVAPTGYGNGRRMSNGFDYNRMSMLIAVMEKRAGYFFGNSDAYVNVIGGLKLDEPATDLPVSLALISSLKDKPIIDSTIAFGEIGLGGEIRAISFCEQRIKEADRLGFKKCIVPRHNLKNLREMIKSDIEIIGVSSINEAFNACTN